MFAKQIYISVSILALSILSLSAEIKPKVVAGELNLQENHLVSGERIKLSGSWRLFWEDFVSPQNLKTGDLAQAPLETLSKSWRNLSYLESSPHGFGYASYALQINTTHQWDNLGLYIPDFFTAHSIYLNGKMIARNGKVGRDFESSVPYSLPQVIDISLNKGVNILVLHVSNFHHHRGGVLNAPVLGLADTVELHHRLRENASLFIAGTLLISSIFSLIGFYFQRRDWAFLFYALFSVCMMYRVLATDTYLIHRFFSGFDRVAALRLEYLSLFAFVTSFAYFYRFQLAPKAPIWLFHLVAILSGIMTLSLFFPPQVFTSFVDYYLPLVGFIALGIIAFYLPAMKLQHSMTWFTGISVLSILIFYGLQLSEHFGTDKNNFFVAQGIYLLFTITTSIALSMRLGYNMRLETFRGINAESGQRNFINSISHELRTPMNAIMGMTDFLSKTELNSEQKTKLETIKTNAENLNDLLLDMLNFSSAEKGQLQLDKRKFKAAELFANAVEKAKKSIGNGKLEFDYRYDKNIPEELVGDPEKITLVITHILGNAFKFTEKGKVGFEVSCTHIEKQDVHLKILVEDTGVGIRKHELEKVLRAFQQGDVGNSRKHGGAGLGLSLASRIVELMDGELWIDSVYGKGTVVECNFSLRTPVQDLGQVTAAVKANNQKLNPNLRILYAEDNPINQKLLSMMLKNMGYEIDLADNGLEAWEMAISKKYHVIFMDIQMPKMDGIEATRRILKDNPHRPMIIALTANADPTERERCSEVGINEFIAKPFNAKVIKESLAKWQGMISYLADDDTKYPIEDISR